MRKNAISWLAAIAILLASASLSARGQDAASDFKVVSVGDGIYAAIGTPTGLAGSNAGFIVGDSGVLVMDTFLTPKAAQELVAEIKARTDQPIKYVVNSHYHIDHTGGNQVFAAMGIPIIAQANVRDWVITRNRKNFLPPAEQLKKQRDDLAKTLAETPADQTAKRQQLERRLKQTEAFLTLDLTPPTVTYDSGTLHVYLGKRDVALFSLPGHTGGDTLAFVSDANVLFMGDMGWTHSLPNLIDATVTDWVQSLDKILIHHPEAKFVPGHGEVATAADMRDFRDYLDDLRNRVKAAIDQGLTLEQAQEQLKLPERFKSFNGQGFVKPNIKDMYNELKGTKQM
jgi:cyclase